MYRVKKIIERNGIGGLSLVISGTLIAVFNTFVDDFVVSPTILIITILSMAFTFIIIYYFASRFYNFQIKRIKEDAKKSNNLLFDHAGLINNDGNKCIYHDFNCCASEIIDSSYYSRIRNNVELSKEDSKKYSLELDTVFDKREKNYYKTHPKGEIWVVSYALETEIKTADELKRFPDRSLEQSMKTVADNIKKGVRYIQFVALGPTGERDTNFENRRKLYWSSLEGEKDEEEKLIELPVIRIDDDFGGLRGRVNDPDMDFLAKLTSTVIFVDESNPAKLDVEGYFCLRPDDSKDAQDFEKKTIMFKMPMCMKNDYYYFLKDKKIEFLKEKGKI